MRRPGILSAILIACLAVPSTGCLSGAYDKDYDASLQQYKREAAGEPPAPPPPQEGAAIRRATESMLTATLVGPAMRRAVPARGGAAMLPVTG